MRISRVLVKLLNRIWLIFATLVITLAIVISLIRALLPFINEVKPNIENFLSDKLATRVTIEKISGEWFRHGPRVTITGLNIWQQEEAQVEVAEAAIAVNIWQSLFQLTFATEEFFLRDSKVVLELSNLGRQSQTTANYTSYDFLIDVLLGQNDVSINDFTLVTRRKGFPEASFSLQSLSIKNYADIHQLDGVILQNEGGQLAFITELDGDPRRPNSTAEVYFKAQDVELSRIPLMDKLVAGVVEKGVLNGEVWAEWEYDEWRSMYMDLSLSPIDFKIARQRFQYQSIASQISWTANESQERTFLLNKLVAKNGDGTEIDLAGLRLSVIGQPSSSINIDYQDIEPGRLNDLWALLIDNDELQSWFLKADPQLFVKNFQLTLKKIDDSWGIEQGIIDVAELGLNRTSVTPGLPPLHGVININKSGVLFDFIAEKGMLDYGSLFRKPIPVDRLEIAGKFYSTGKDSQLQLNKLDLQLDSITVKANGNIYFHETADPEISLQAELLNADLKKVPTFLPVREGDDQLATYLEQSIHGGIITNAHFNLQGRLVDDFNKQTDLTFEILAHAEGLDYQYLPGYPKLDELDATLYFNQDAMFVAADKARYKQLEVLKANAEINQFSANIPFLKLDLTVNTNYKSASDFISNSELKSDLEPVLSALKIDKKFISKIKLRVPLEGEDAIQLNGELILKDNNVELTDLGLQLKNVNTSVAFTEDKITAKKIRAELFDGSIQGSIATEQADSETRLRVKATADSNISSALNWLFPTNKLLVSGDTELNINGWLCIANCLTWQTDLSINSNLSGVALDYINPIKKSASESGSFAMRIQQGEQLGKLNFELQNSLFGSLTFSPENNQFKIKQGSISLGTKGQAVQVSSDSLLINGQLPLTSLPELAEQLTSITETFNDGSADDDKSAPTNLSFAFVGIELAGITLDDVNITMSEVPGKAISETAFYINSKQATGKFYLLEDSSIKIELDSFILEQEALDKLTGKDDEQAKEQQQTSKESVEDNHEVLVTAEEAFADLVDSIAKLPDISLICLKCQIGNYNLGRLEINSVSSQETWNLEGQIQREQLLTSNFTVQWDMKTDRSLLKQKFSSGDFGRLLRDLGLNVGVRDSAADGEFELSWTGAPFAFNVASLSGQTKLYLNKGYLEEVSDARARIFSLFSLQSVTRRLTLDFEDIYKDGFFFNSLSGLFELNNGMVETKKLEVDGAAADVSLSGKVDLVAQTVDQIAVVSPKVTSSLPVLAGWAVEPTTGIIVWLLSKLFEPAIDVITKIEYRVVGKWDKPQVIEQSKSTKEVELTPEQLEAIREVQKERNN